MKYRTFLPNLSVLIIFAAFSKAVAGAALPNDSHDLVALSQRTWGSSINDFPARANLQPGEFRQGDDPVPGSHDKVITVQVAKWTPAELPPFASSFRRIMGCTKYQVF
jgi:hypothetical protein